MSLIKKLLSAEFMVKFPHLKVTHKVMNTFTGALYRYFSFGRSGETNLISVNRFNGVKFSDKGL